MNTTTYDLDIEKRVFHLYWVEAETGEIGSRRFGKQALIEFLSQRKPGQVALEACGSAHWWARRIASLGHDVKLLHAKFVRPFVQTNKTDAADAHAIWTAAPRLGGISKRGDVYLRTLLIHGARTVLFRSKEKGIWCDRLRQRRPTNVAAVAIANKMVRTAWALLVHRTAFEKNHVSERPA